MKTQMTMFRTLAVLLALGFGASGCFATSGEKKMMDESMNTSTETMEKDTMNETMPAPMGIPEPGSMGSGFLTMPTMK